MNKRLVLQSFLTVFLCLFSAACAVAGRGGENLVFTERVVASGDAKIAVRDIGAGPVIVMIPSVGRSSHDFDDLARSVAKAGWHAVLPEPRGTDGSSGPLDDLTLTDYGRDILAVVNATTADPVVILGHAAGARDARIAIGLAPARFSRLISIATGAGGGADISPALDPARAAAAQEAVSAQGELPDAQRLAALQMLFFAPGNDASVWLTGWTPRAARAHSAASRRTPRQQWWPGVPIASLVIEAQQDPVAPMKGQALVALLGHDATIVSLPHASHAMLPEQPEALAAVVTAYLKGQTSGLQAVINAHIRKTGEKS